MAVAASEIKPGIVIHASEEKLVEYGGCRTIAKLGYQAKGEHFFLVVKVDEEQSSCLCTPLHSVPDKILTNDRVVIDQRLKQGKPEGWTDDETYFFKWDFWEVPLAAFEAASQTDNSDGDRRWYAREDAMALAAVSEHLHRARQPWRAI